MPCAVCALVWTGSVGGRLLYNGESAEVDGVREKIGFVDQEDTLQVNKDIPLTEVHGLDSLVDSFHWISLLGGVYWTTV